VGRYRALWEVLLRLGLVAILFSAACSPGVEPTDAPGVDSDVATEAEPALTVSPAVVDLALGGVDAQGPAVWLTLSEVGGALVVLERIELSGPGAAWLSLEGAETPLRLEAWGATTIGLRLDPHQALGLTEDAALIVVASGLSPIEVPVRVAWPASCDGDGDGVAAAACGGGDCDDANAQVGPGRDELCNGRDDDCDGAIDEDAVNAGLWYDDVDGDLWGDAAHRTCAAPPDAALRPGDCDDLRADVFPGAPEVCENVDHDCDGEVGESCPPSDCGDPAIMVDDGYFYAVEPTGWTGGPLDAVLLFGNGSIPTAQDWPCRADLTGLITETGALVVVPVSADGQWHPTGRATPPPRDDLDYLQAVTAEVRRRYPAQQLWGIGYSIGGTQISEYACLKGGLAGVASIAGPALRPLPAVCPAGPYALVQVHGALDTYVPPEGRYLPGLGANFASVDESVALVATTNSCDALSHALPASDNTYACEAFDGCPPNFPVQRCEYQGDHRVPQQWVGALWERLRP